MRFRILILLAGVLLISVGTSGQKQANSEAELRRQADRFFQDQAYATAVGPYSQLLSLHPDDATLNYRYGVSLLLSGKDKRSALGYLEKAMNDATQPVEGWVYLGRSYMFLGKYEDAKNCFSRFGQRATDQLRKKFNSDEWMRAAMAAQELSRHRRLMSVTSQKEVSRTAFFSQIDYSQTAGRVLPTAEKFLTTADKDKQSDPVMFMSRDGQTIYYASFGKGSLGGKDLYLIRKMTNGEWAQPEHLGGVVNTAMNEDFPFLDRDGKTLYFASQGHNAIGGYDLFKSVYNFNTGQWSAPENLGIPINSPDDDLLYIPGPDGLTATYATADFSDNAHTELRTIRLDDLRNPFATIRGTYYSIDQPMRRDARLIVLRANDRSVVTTVRTDPRTGAYELVLPGGEAYWLVVDGGGYVPHTEAFDLPAGLEKAALRQEVRMNRDKQDERMTVSNYFTPMPTTVDAAVIAVNDRPTSARTSSTSAAPETIQVTVGNETITIRKPQEQADHAAVATDARDPVTAAQDAMEDTTSPDNYNPLLERELTNDEIRQRQEEELRKEEVTADEKIPVDKLLVPVDERELARTAVADGVALQSEADSLQAQSEALRISAANREEEALRLLEEAQSIREDTVRAANLYLQSDDMKQLALAEKQQSRQLGELARERRTEARQALTDAKALINSTNSKDKTLYDSVNQALARNAQGPVLAQEATKDRPTAYTKNQDQAEGNAVEVRTEGVSTPAQPSAAEPTANGVIAEQDRQPSGEAVSEIPASQQEQPALALVPEATPARAATETPQGVSERMAPTEVAAPVTVPENREQAVASEEKVNNDREQVSENRESVSVNTSPAERAAADAVSQPTVAEGSQPVPLKAVSSGPSTGGPSSAQVTTTESNNGPGEDKSVVNAAAQAGVSTEPVRSELPAVPKQSGETGVGIAQNKPATAPATQPVQTAPVKEAATGDQDTRTVSTSVPATANAVDAEPADKSGATAGTEVKTTAGDRTNPPAVSVVSEPKQQQRAVTRTAPVTRLTEVPAMEGVSEETRVAYQNYKQRMEFSERLDARSKELQTQVSTMKNSPERDSLIQLSNSMSMESIRQWQSAQQQLQLAKADDPEIQNKAESAIAAAKAAHPEVEPAVTAQESAVTMSQERNGVSLADGSGNDRRITANQPNTSTSQESKDGSTRPLSGDEPGLAANQPAAAPGTIRSKVSAPPTPAATVDRSKEASTSSTKDSPQTDVTKANQAVAAGGETRKNKPATNVPAEQQPAVDPSVGAAGQQSDVEADSNSGNPQQTAAGVTPVPAATSVADRSLARQSDNPSAGEQVLTTPVSSAVNVPTAVTQTSPASTDASVPVSKVAEQAAGADQQTVQAPVQKPESSDDRAQQQPVASQRTADATTPESKTNAVSGIPADAGTGAVRTEQPASQPATAAEQEPAAAQPTAGQVELVYDTAAVRSRLQTNDAVPVAQLDSSHKDFPRYLKLRQEVGEKQDETIRLFSSAIELNKKASQEKEEQVDLMQKAEATAVAGEKAKLLRTAEKRKRDSEEHEAEAGKLMAQAQKLSDEIWENNQTLEALSLAIRKSGPARTSPATVPGTAGTTAANARPATVPEMDETVRADVPVSAQQTANDRAPVKAGPLTVPGIERMVVRSDKPAYSSASPIPVDQPLPEGLVFKVQIGAFRKPIPNEAFGGLSPVSGENTRPGWIRYCVGLFRTFEPANLVKKAMRGQGFKDAFVVAYYNGKRISLGEAYALLNQAGGDSRTAYASASREEMQRLRELNILPVRSAVPDADEQEFFGGTVVSTVGSTGGVAYAVQVGVYRSSVPPAILGSLQPLQQETLSKGLFRYSTGRYSSYASADSMRRIAVSNGIGDAFVVAYRDGRRVSLSSAQRSNPNSLMTTLVPARPAGLAPDAQPAAETGTITFRVQVGAFRQQVPFRVVDALLKVSDRGVEREQDPRGLQVFFAGRFSDYESARKIKEEVVGRGVPDAFVVAFDGTKRIPLAEALRRVGQ